MKRRTCRHTRALLPALAMVLGVMATACGEEAPTRAEVVGAMTDSRVPAQYEELAAAAANLAEQSNTWCGGDRANPDELLAQVTEVRDEWATLRPFWFGPVMDRRSQGLIDYPVVVDDVASLSASDTELTTTSLRELVGADQRGLGSIEVLAAPESGVPDDRSCTYLVAAAALVAEETAALATEWKTFGPTLSVDDEAANAALAEIVSETVFGLALTAGDNPKAAGQLAGARLAMLGDGTDGHRGISPLLDEDVIEQLTADFDALAANPSSETEMAVERTIKTNVVGDLGLTLKFSDADGDG